MDNHEHGANLEKMRPLFVEMDTDKDDCLNEVELKALFEKYGCNVTRATMHNLVRLVDDTNSGVVHWDQFSKVFDIIEEVRENSHFGKDKPPSKSYQQEDEEQERKASKGFAEA